MKVSPLTQNAAAVPPVPEDGHLLASALLGTVAMEAGLISRSLETLQGRIGDMLQGAALDDADIADLQMFDQLTQRIADLAIVLDAAGQKMDGKHCLPVDPLIAKARLHHTRTIIAELDPDFHHAAQLSADGADQTDDDITLF